MHCDTPNGGAKSRDVSWARFSIVGKFHVSHAEFLKDLLLKSFQLVWSFTNTFCWSLKSRFLWSPSSVKVEIFVYRFMSLPFHQPQKLSMHGYPWLLPHKGKALKASPRAIGLWIHGFSTSKTHPPTIRVVKKTYPASTRLTFWFCLALRHFFSSWRIFQRGLRQSDKLDGKIMDFPPRPVPIHLAGFSKVIGWEKWHPKRSFRKTRTNKNP